LHVLIGLNPYAQNTWISEYGIDENDHYALYFEGLFWACITLCTVGYRNFIAKENILELYLSISLVIIGGLFFSIFLSIVSNLVFQRVKISLLVANTVRFLYDLE
jgi:hypothetical protein